MTIEQIGNQNDPLRVAKINDFTLFYMRNEINQFSAFVLNENGDIVESKVCSEIGDCVKLLNVAVMGSYKNF